MAPTTPNLTASPPHSETETEEGLSPSKTRRPMPRRRLKAQKQLPFQAEQRVTEIPTSISHNSNHMHVAIARQQVELQYSPGEVMALRETEIVVVKARVDKKEMSNHEDKQERINFDKADTTIGKRLGGEIEPYSTGTSGSTRMKRKARGSDEDGNGDYLSTNPAHGTHEDKKLKSGPRENRDAKSGRPLAPRKKKNKDALGLLPQVRQT